MGVYNDCVLFYLIDLHAWLSLLLNFVRILPIIYQLPQTSLQIDRRPEHNPSNPLRPPPIIAIIILSHFAQSISQSPPIKISQNENAFVSAFGLSGLPMGQKQILGLREPGDEGMSGQLGEVLGQMEEINFVKGFACLEGFFGGVQISVELLYGVAALVEGEITSQPLNSSYNFLFSFSLKIEYLALILSFQSRVMYNADNLAQCDSLVDQLLGR